MTKNERLLKTLIKCLPLRFRTSAFYRMKLHTGGKVQMGESTVLEYNKKLVFSGLESDLIYRGIFFTGYYEHNITEIICKLAVDGGVMIDAGANQGYYSLLFAGANENNKVYSFEPSPRNIGIIKDNTVLNRAVIGDKIILCEYGLGDKEETVTFHLGNESQTGWGSVTISNGVTEKIEINIKTIDECVPPIPIKVLKVDVEGYDMNVILGASKMIKNKLISNILFECHENFLNDTAEKIVMVRDLLSQNNYQISKLDGTNYWAKINK